MKRQGSLPFVTHTVLALAASVSASAAFASGVALHSDGTRLSFTPDSGAPAHQLRILGPAPFLVEQTVLAGEALSVPLGSNGTRWKDGAYTFEIVPVMGVAVRDGNAFTGYFPDLAATRWGSFAIRNGEPVIPTTIPEAQRTSDQDPGPGAKDQVIPDDLIVQGSTCVGLDCVSDESFGFDTLRLKENNTRIAFFDTSTGAFPATHWQLTANESASGGLNKFSIEDITAATVPFTVQGAAPTNSIFVDAIGRVGFRTATPVLDLHVTTGNTPALRMEQTNAGGFNAQTWDVAGNEANFFVRDVTGGSRLPFRIRPGAPTSSLDISAAGNVGINTASPQQALHVFGTDGSTTLLVQETNATAVGRTLLQLSNNGPTRLKLNDTNSGVGWVMNANGNEYRLSTEGAAVTPFTFQSDGDLVITGVLTQGSSRDMKHNFRPLDAADVLQRVRDLEVTRWNYRNDAQQTEHIGPMSQDFNAAFNVGERSDRLALLDVNGVTVVAIQELARQLDERDQRIRDLETKLDALQAATATLAARMATLPDATTTTVSARPPAAATSTGL